MEVKKERESDRRSVLGLEYIKSVLPHRYPFLLVDRILEMTDHRVVGLKSVSGCEPFFQGHFPARAVMPGVLIVEALAQVGGILMLSKGENKGKMAYLASINHARFRRIVLPGDTLRMEIELLKLKLRVGLINGVAKVEGEEVCSAQIMFSLVE